MAKEEFIVTSGSAAASQKQRYALRMAESFFRRWPLYILPIALLVGVGVLQARNVVADYQSIGVVSVVNNPLLGDLSTIQNAGANNYETPAGGTARTMNELLATDGFVKDVAERGGFGEGLATGAVNALDIRSHVYASANGYQLLTVVAKWPNAQGAQSIAQATIDAYIAYLLQSQVAKAKDASTFWEARASVYQDKVTEAQAALQDYISKHPAPSVGERPEAEQLQIGNLTSAIDQAQAQVTNALTEKENADLTTQELTTEAGQGLQVLDAPVLPNAPESIRKKQALTLAIFLVLGFIIAAALLLISTFLDRTVRAADDISTASGLTVIATVPTIPALRRRDPSKTFGRDEASRALAAG